MQSMQEPENNEIRNPTIPKINSIKTFDECRLRFIKRPMRPATSVARDDYDWKTPVEMPQPSKITLPSAVPATAIIIDRSKQSHVKHLDPNATTQRLSYVQYTPEQIVGGICAHDNITFWNWKYSGNKKVIPERDMEMCDNLPSKQCRKAKTFPTLVKHVPHGGMNTEIRSNYIEPKKREIPFNTSAIKNGITHMPILPFAKKSEYALYGSGERTQKFV